MDHFFDLFDDLLLEGRFEKIDNILLSLETDTLSSEVLVGLLSITLAAKEELKHREKFVEKAERRMRRIDPDRADNLIEGLR